VLDEPAGEVLAVQERAAAGEHGDADFEEVEPGGAPRAASGSGHPGRPLMVNSGIGTI
jgi:hypothetical protein